MTTDSYRETTEGLKRLRELTEHNDDCLKNTLGDTKLIDAPFWPDYLARGTMIPDPHDKLATHYCPDDEHDRADATLRDLLCCIVLPPDPHGHPMIDRPELDPILVDQQINWDNDNNDPLMPDGYHCDEATAREMAHHINMLLHEMTESAWLREPLTEMTLSQSLCPIHFVDYAICFDDEETDCATIRLIHPSHDT